MRILKRSIVLYVAVALLPGFLLAGHAVCAESMGQLPYDAYATVTFVEGAPVLAGPASVPRVVTVGQALSAGGTVQTDSVSRVELTFSGGGVVRLAEDTTLELGTGAEDAATSGVRIQAMLLKGAMWANFSNQHRKSVLQILVTGAMFSGPESVFRAAMFKEGAVEVKTYSGQVTASGPFEITNENGRYELGALKGGEEATPEPWQYQISPYCKMIVLASGEASQPFRFAAKSDLTDWVRWNQQRDESMK